MDAENLKSSLKELQQELASLEWSYGQLKLRHKSKHLEARELDLKHVIQRMQRVEDYILAEDNLANQVQSRQFPPTKFLLLDEVDSIKRVVSKCAQSKVNFISRMNLYRSWAEQSSEGKGRLHAIFRLTKVHRSFKVLKSSLEWCLTQIKLEQNHLKVIVQKVLGPRYDASKDVLEQCSSAFLLVEDIRAEVSRANAQISECKQYIFAEKQKIGSIRRELKDLDAHLNPSLESLARMAELCCDSHFSQKQWSGQKVDLASVYIESYVKRYRPWGESSIGDNIHGS